MRPPLQLRTAAVLAAWPGVVLCGLVAAGSLGWQAALAAAGLVALGALALAGIWVQDLARVLRRLHGGAARDDSPPFLSATAHLTRAVDRLLLTLAEREAACDTRIRIEQHLVQHLPDPIVILDAARRVQRMNTAAEAAFGPAFAAVLRHPGLRAALDRAQATGQHQTSDLTLPVPVAREVSATIIPLTPPLAEGGRFVLVLSDRTRDRAVERMRADFVANASHELRTPLTSLIGFIDTLRGPAADDPPAQARFLGIMADQAERMNRLIDDLLSLSRIELVEHQPPADRVDVAALLHRAAAAFEPQLAARRIRLDLVTPPDPAIVPGDEDQLDQVLHNLLDNAIKYGRPGGTVRVTATLIRPGALPARPQPGGSGGGGIAITVADDGPGVPRAHIPRLTERFYRADKHRSRAVGGTGLGLAIVKHIVNRHRGQLAIDSIEGPGPDGTGTTVTIWLPTQPAGSAAAAPA